MPNRGLLVVDGDNIENCLRKIGLAITDYRPLLDWVSTECSVDIIDAHFFISIRRGHEGSYDRSASLAGFQVHESYVQNHHGYKDEEIRKLIHVRQEEFDTLILASSDADFFTKETRLRRVGKQCVRLFTDYGSTPWLDQWVDRAIRLEQFFNHSPDAVRLIPEPSLRLP